MEHGARSKEHGAWAKEHRAWSKEHGARSMEQGARSMEKEARSKGQVAWSMEQGARHFLAVFRKSSPTVQPAAQGSLPHPAASARSGQIVAPKLNRCILAAGPFPAQPLLPSMLLACRSVWHVSLETMVAKSSQFVGQRPSGATAQLEPFMGKIFHVAQRQTIS